MKNCNDTIGNRTRDLRACSSVPQPTGPPRTPNLVVYILLLLVCCIIVHTDIIYKLIYSISLVVLIQSVVLYYTTYVIICFKYS